MQYWVWEPFNMSSGFGKGKGQVSTCEKAIIEGISFPNPARGLLRWHTSKLLKSSTAGLGEPPKAGGHAPVGFWALREESGTWTWKHSFWIWHSFCTSSWRAFKIGSSTPGPLVLRLATPLSFPRCTFCWAELGKVFTSLILFLPSLPSIPFCFFPFLNHYHNLGFKTISIRQRQSQGGKITFMCGLNTEHKLLPGKENKNFALEHAEYSLLKRNYSTVLHHVLNGHRWNQIEVLIWQGNCPQGGSEPSSVF